MTWQEAAAPRPPVRPLSDWVRAAIALFVVFGGGWLFGHLWLFRDVEDAQKLGAALSGLVGLVVGHYFGHQGIDRAEAEAAQAREREALVRTLAAGLAAEDQAAQRKLAGVAAQAEEYQRLLAAASADPALREKLNHVLASIRGDVPDGP